MANVEHSTLVSASVHEPKHITINGTGSSGKVITNSSSTSGVSEYRTLTMADIDTVEEFLTFTHTDTTSTETHYLVTPTSGLVVGAYAVIDNALVTADLVYTFTIDGNSPTPSTMTFDFATTAQGDVESVTFSANNTVTAGSVITLDGNGGNTDANVSAFFTFIIRRAN